ncbi:MULTISPECIES: CGNR zinc finger domain-containing protein [Streptomyces]|uniref:CGNR zinc finger domain-containing protein n=1 Tax=Streptomyces TaxID=1883 RepID=UPI001360E4CC|nr:hypothetical protein [Streptomyces sp. SID724]
MGGVAPVSGAGGGSAPCCPLFSPCAGSTARTGPTVCDVLALRAEELLGGDGLGRIRRCAGPGCGWFFVDRSRSGSRRWCSSRDCGNRDRARRHYARTRQRG